MTIQMMRQLYFALATLCVIIPSAAVADIVYEVDFVITAPTNIVAFDTARAGSDRFRRTAFVKTPVLGGTQSATVMIRDGGDGCVRDLRIRLADNSVLIRRGLDLCREPENSADTTRRRIPLR